jgi:hypothetical protein
MGSKQFAFRFDEELIDLIKEKAKSQRRSLNNYIEFLLFKDVGYIPNAETVKAIEEVRSGDGEKIDDLEDWMENI